MKERIAAHPKASLLFACAFLVFIGCFTFPLFNFTPEAPKVLRWLNLATALAAYSEIGRLFLKSLLTEKQIRKTAIITLSMTVLGLLFRFLMEFGEVSNVYNFTLPNVAVHLLTAVVVVCFCAYGKETA